MSGFTKAKFKKGQIMMLDGFNDVMGIVPSAYWLACDEKGDLDEDTNNLGDHVIMQASFTVEYRIKELH